MAEKYDSRTIPLQNLVLDKNNPRFAELYNGSDSESDIIEYLLYTESADELCDAISKSGEFYEDRPLWVFKTEDGKYLVKDGNRRCAAVKALQVPNKYDLGLPRLEFKELPVLEYHNLSDLETRMRIEHNSSLFKKWGRIAKAIEIYRLFSSGNSLPSLKEIDSNPRDFIKTATFYHQAAKIKGEDFKKLVREGRKDKGGKTVVFERLFKVRKICGYTWSRKTSEIIIKDSNLFTLYVSALVDYIIDHPDTSSRLIDNEGVNKFIERLKPYGFPPKREETDEDENTDDTTDNSNNSNTQNTETTSDSDQNVNNDTSNSSSDNSNQNSQNNQQNNSSSRHSVKDKPTLKRKKIPSTLKTLIEECYKLDKNNFANAKTALTRVTFECTLKYIVENTEYEPGKKLDSSPYFRNVFFDGNNIRRTYTNFAKLKPLFTELIKVTRDKKAFQVFDLEKPHQIIHNYIVGAVPADAKALCDNLIGLLDFMLQDEQDLINSLDLSKL